METFKITIAERDFIVICLPNRPKALLDRTVAEIYEMETKRINEAVKNNPEKFPEDFYFQLTRSELRELQHEVENFDLMWKKGHTPKAFTHLGCNMLATILKSGVAVQRAIQIIRTFTALESGNFAERMLRVEENHAKMQNQLDRMEASLNFLIWEGRPEQSPVVQIQQRIQQLEDQIDILFRDGRFRRLQTGVIYSGVQKLKEYVKNQLPQQMQGEWKGELHQHRENFWDFRRQIQHRLERMEKKLEDCLSRPGEKEKALSLKQSLSDEQIERLRELVAEKGRGDKKEIMGIWSAFRKHFGITRYKFLSPHRFEEAILWIGK